jgi:sugar-specific transcriptional regulator TrmB
MPRHTKHEDDIQTLTRLGLTPHQSKIYLALSKIERGTIKTLSLMSKIDRANVHRSITKLQNLGLVEKLITYPTTFKALPMNEGIAVLLERRRMEYEENVAKAKELLERSGRKSHVAVTEDGCQFVFVPGGKLTYRILSELIDSSDRTHDGIVYRKDLEQRKDFFVDLFRKLSLKGLKIRLIVFLEKEKKLPTAFEVFRNCEQIEMRRVRIKPRATFSIWDGKKAFLTVTPRISNPMTSGLLMDNPALVGLIQDYFEIVWRRSKIILS